MPKVIFYALAALLCVAALPMPYGIYTLVRILTTLFFAMLAWIAYLRNDKMQCAFLVAAAVLFNPVISIYLPKILWSMIDLAVAFWVAFDLKHRFGE